MARNILVFFFALMLFSCTEGEKKETLLPAATGKAGEVVLVINENQEAGAIGKAFSSVFGQFQVGLPQDEPLFDLITIPPAAFRNVFERHRNIIDISIKPEYKKSEVLVKRDVWSYPQLYVSLRAHDEQCLVQLVDSVQNNMLKLFMSEDRKRIVNYYGEFCNRTISRKLTKLLGCDMVVPQGYGIDMADSSFVWISHEARDLSQGIIIYTQEYTSTEQLSVEGILQYRDTLFKERVSGPREGSYMQTELEMYVPVPAYGNIIAGQYSVELRGLWNVQNDYMGGPFISYSVHDAARNRIVTLFGYVYAPRLDKRNYVRQLESIFKSFSFVSEPDK